MFIRRITSAKEIEEIQKFRHKIFVDELNWMSQSGGKLADEYDQYAINYAAYDDDRTIIGAIRIVVDTDVGLPLEKFYSLDKYRKNNVLVEIGKLAIAPNQRSTRMIVALLAVAYQEACKLGCTHGVLDTFLDRERMYRSLGFRRLSEPYVDPASNRDMKVVAMIAPITTVHNELREYRPFLARILAKQDKNTHLERFNETAIAVEELSVYK